MKVQRVIALVFLVSLFALLSQVVEAAEYAVKPGDTKYWRVEISDSPYFSEEYWAKGVHIFVRTDGRGVAITAIDPDYYGKTLEQFIEIRQEEEGVVRKRESWTVWEAKIVNDGEFFLYLYRNRETIGYDIFYVKYLEKAKKLPPHVKKMFFGYYGLG